MGCLCYDRKVRASPTVRYPWVRYRLYTLLPGRWTGGCSLLHRLNVLNAADSFPTGLIKYTLHYTDNTQLYLITVSPRLFHCSSLCVNYVSSLLSLWAGHKCVKQTPHLCWCSLSVVLTLKRFKSAAPGKGKRDVREGGGVFRNLLKQSRGLVLCFSATTRRETRPSCESACLCFTYPDMQRL